MQWHFYKAIEDTMGQRPSANGVNEEMVYEKQEGELQVWLEQTVNFASFQRGLFDMIEYLNHFKFIMNNLLNNR